MVNLVSAEVNYCLCFIYFFWLIEFQIEFHIVYDLSVRVRANVSQVHLLKEYLRYLLYIAGSLLNRWLLAI